MNILMSLMILSMVFVMVTMSQASAERICEVLNEKSDLHNPEDPCYEVKDGSIEFRHVNFSYHKTSEKPVLQDINLSIRAGETIGIIGGTGSCLLYTSGYKQGEVAAMAGYRDVKHFTRVFKKYVGISPSEYRKLMRE